MDPLYWPDIRLRISEHGDGALVEQDLSKISAAPIFDTPVYVARRWFLPEHASEIAEFVEACRAHGMVYALQHNHPLEKNRGPVGRGHFVDYIGFGRRYDDRPAWDCAIDGASQRGKRTVCVSRRHAQALQKHGVGFGLEGYGGRNCRVAWGDLERALRAIVQN